MLLKLAFTLQRSLNPCPNNLFGYDYAILWPPFVHGFIRFLFQTFRVTFVLSGSLCLLDKRKNHICKQILKKNCWFYISWAVFKAVAAQILVVKWKIMVINVEKLKMHPMVEVSAKQH